MTVVTIPLQAPPTWSPAFDGLRIGETQERGLDATQWAMAAGVAVSSIDVAIDPLLIAASVPAVTGAQCLVDLTGGGVPGTELPVVFTIRFAGTVIDRIVVVRQPIQDGVPPGLHVLTDSSAPIGEPTGAGIVFVAEAAISGHRALMFGAAGGVLQADPTLLSYVFAGLSLGAAAAGTGVAVAEDGAVVTEPSWSWPPEAPLFVAAGGHLTTTPPTSGILHQVAWAIAPTRVIVQPGTPVLRA